jgi:hypothetical protein
MIRNALAKIVSTRFTPAVRHVQRTVDHSQVRIPQTRPQGSVTEVPGSVPIRQVAAWCWPLLGTTFSGWEA